MKNSSQTHHCRLETRRKEEQKMQQNEAQQILVTTCEIAHARHYSSCNCSQFSTVHLHFTLLLFLLQFLISSHFVLVTAFSFSFFFGNFLYTEHLYKSQSVQTKNDFTFGNRWWAAVLPLLPPFPIFFPFLSLSRLPNTPLRMTTQRMLG